MADPVPATVVLVHGAGAGGWIWYAVAAELDRLRVPHAAPDLPTTDPRAGAGVDFHSDAAHVRSVLNGIDGPIVLCGNSYGGAVITEASAGSDQVLHLVYLAAFMPDAGEGLLEFMAAHSNPDFFSAVRMREDGLMEFDPELEQALAMQQARPEVGVAAAARTRPWAVAADPPTVNGVGWRDIPSTYVVCTEDRSILLSAQRGWAAERATACVEVPYDHCPQLSHPGEIAALLAELAMAARRSLQS
jgi:pimeloyl-ACP methyl ester carboxylesterase